MNNLTQTDIRSPFLKGYDAYKDNWPISDNPYSTVNGWGAYQSHTEWNRGYLAAQANHPRK